MALVKMTNVTFPRLQARGRVVLQGGVRGSAVEAWHVGLSVQGICVNQVQEPAITVIA